MSRINIKNNNILYYFLITSIHPKKKIFELINTNDREIYIEANEILTIYINRKRNDIERTKIKSRNNAFHIFISNEELMFLSYTNKKFFSTELNFQLFDEINDYLIKNFQGRFFSNRSFLIEDEKEVIKDIINNYIEEIISIKTIDSFLDSAETEKENEKFENEKEVLKVDVNSNIIREENEEEKNEMDTNKKEDNNIIVKKILKNNSRTKFKELSDKTFSDKDKKNESSEDKIIKNKITNNPSVPYIKSAKSNNILLKNENKNSKTKYSSKTVFGNHANLKNRILEGKNISFKEKPNNNNIKSNHDKDNNRNYYSYKNLDYNNLNFKKNKSDSCSKNAIIGILISIVVLQIAAIPIIINFYDYSI